MSACSRHQLSCGAGEPGVGEQDIGRIYREICSKQQIKTCKKRLMMFRMHQQVHYLSLVKIFKTNCQWTKAASQFDFRVSKCKYLLYSLSLIIVEHCLHVWANTSPGFTLDEWRVSNSEGAELELHFLSSHIKYFRFLGWNWKRRRVLLQRRGGVWAWAICSANKRSLFGSEDGDRDTIFHWQPPHHSLLSTNIGNVLSSKWLNVLRCWKISWKCQITAELSSVQWLDVLIPIAV